MTGRDSTQEEAEDAGDAPRLWVRLVILLPVIFGAVHLLGLLRMMLSGVSGDGALAIVIWDWPVFLVCGPLGRYLCSWTHSSWVLFAVVGTPFYALFGLVIGAALDRFRIFIAERRSHWRSQLEMPLLNAPLQVRLAAIFGGINLLIAATGIVSGGFNGEGIIGLVVMDLPVAALCAYTGIGRNMASYGPGGWGLFMLAGALTYSLFGFAIGNAIDRIRTFIARRRG